jgi:Protein of unknown function (DUF3500)
MQRTTIVVGLSVLVSVLAGCGAATQTTQMQNTTAKAAPVVDPARENDATGRTVAAANAFLATLDDAGRAKVNFPFDGDQKTKWSNFPNGIYPRNGLRMGDLNAAQRDALMKLLATALSASGLKKVNQIMDGDEDLKKSDTGLPGGGPPGGSQQGAPPGPPPGEATGQQPGARRGPPQGMNPGFGRDNYFIAFLGKPSLTDPWMIQFGGHHLAINLTIVGQANVMTPSLPAAQPAVYQLNGETVRPLGRENDKSFQLINALDAAQQKQAILNYQVSDLVLGPGQDGKIIQPEGIKASSLKPGQQEMLLDLAHEWVGILNDEAAAIKMAELKSNIAETWFAWSGPITNGKPAYFRIQGPTVVIEYSPQRMGRSTELDTNHIHTIYRDPTNDYGRKLIGK